MAYQEKNKEFDHKLLEVRRTARVVAGGRRFSFRAAVVVGDRVRRVGTAMGKGRDVQTAVSRAVAKASRLLLTVPSVHGTIPHASEAKFRAARVLLRPAATGRGIIAGGAARTVCELAGLRHITAKVLSRTTNKINVARATIKALTQLKSRKHKSQAPEHKQSTMNESINESASL